MLYSSALLFVLWHRWL